jgi:hypothetical protein
VLYSIFITLEIVFIRHYLPFDIMSHLAFITFAFLFFRHYLPFDIMSHLAFILLLTVCPFVIIYHSTFCPFDVYLLLYVFLSTYCPFRRFVRQIFLLRRFVRRRFLLRRFVGESKFRKYTIV